MERDEFMTRNEWLVQFLFTLMVILVIGLVLRYGATMTYGEEPIGVTGMVLSILPGIDVNGVLFGFIYAIVAFFLMGALGPKKRRPIKV